MSDRLIICEIEASCRLGVSEREQAVPQPVWIDVDLGIDAVKAAARDEMANAVDYAVLVSSVRALAQARAYRLMETLAETIAALILERFETPQVRVRVKKKALAGVGYAAVDVERTARRPRRPRTFGSRRPATRGAA